MNISEIIRSLVQSWDCSAFQINCGECEDFAWRIIERLGLENETDTTYIRADPVDEQDEFGNKDLFWPSHYWLVHEGKHYDAECPQGVDCWHDLPIFALWAKKCEHKLQRTKTPVKDRKQRVLVAVSDFLASHKKRLCRF